MNGDDYVETENGLIKISNVSMTDKYTHVKTLSEKGDIVFSPIIYWIHSDPNLEVEFVVSLL